MKKGYPMKTSKKLQIEHRLTYFDVVWALEGLAISGTLGLLIHTN